jgi:hypothetical protein
VTEISASEYRQLLSTALGYAKDADTSDPDLRRLFTPGGHRQALDPDVTVVRGARGSGKTVWFKALTEQNLRTLAADYYQLPGLSAAVATECFGTRNNPTAYPSQRTINQIITEKHQMIDLWDSIIGVGLGMTELERYENWTDKIGWIRHNPEDFERSLARSDSEAGANNETRILLFDGLEHLHANRGKADQLVSSLLQSALSLRLSTKRIRAKVFIRPDMYESAPKDFPDASKLGTNARDLEWSAENLYGLLFHQIGNAESETAEKFRSTTGKWKSSGPDRHTPPDDLTSDSARQSEVFVNLAGQYMGANHRKGYTYTWLPNHLQDGNWAVSPRSFLSAVSKAVEVSSESYPQWQYPLHYEGIRQGVQAASRTRVDEITEDVPWAAEAAKLLEDQQVPIDPDTVIDIWRTKGLADRIEQLHAEEFDHTGPQNPKDYHGLVNQLVELGVMTWRTTGKLDLPDVYRIAFRLGRKGGIPRQKN